MFENKSYGKKHQKPDWIKLWSIFENVFRVDETYAFSPKITEEDAHKIRIESPKETYVAVGKDEEVLGTYSITSNQSSPGSHVRRQLTRGHF